MGSKSLSLFLVLEAVALGDVEGGHGVGEITVVSGQHGNETKSGGAYFSICPASMRL